MSETQDKPEAEPTPQEYKVVAAEGAPQEYKVIWEMDIPADSPEEAARQARAYQRDEKAIVGVFEVYDEAGKAYKVDLDELDGVDVN
jgi:hypothetical protein